MHLVGPVGEPQHARGGIGVGEAVIGGDPGAAKGLDRSVDDPAGHIGRGDFDHRDLGARCLVAVFVHHPRGFQGQEPRLFDHDARVGVPLLRNGLVRAV